MIAQSRRALEYLHPENLSVRTITSLTLGIAHQLQGDRAAAGRAFAEAMAIGQASGNMMIAAAAASSLGQVQESENQLHQAAETYRRLLSMVGDPAHMATCEAHHGLARIFYEWNDLDAAEQHAQQCARLAQQIECDTLRCLRGAACPPQACAGRSGRRGCPVGQGRRDRPRVELRQPDPSHRRGASTCAASPGQSRGGRSGGAIP